MNTALNKKYSFDKVHDSQKVFRLVLEAFSHPAKMVSIQDYASSLFGEHPSFLAVAMVLLDNEVSFNTCENRQLSDEIVSLTHAKKTLVEAADFIFICDTKDIETAIRSVRIGTLADPHKSATIVIRNVQNTATPLHILTLSGPGIDGATTLWVTQTVLDTIALRDAQYYEYPQGIDLLFISEEGILFAIPRLVRRIPVTQKMHDSRNINMIPAVQTGFTRFFAFEEVE